MSSTVVRDYHEARISNRGIGRSSRQHDKTGKEARLFSGGFYEMACCASLQFMLVRTVCPKIQRHADKSAQHVAAHVAADKLDGLFVSKGADADLSGVFESGREAGVPTGGINSAAEKDELIVSSGYVAQFRGQALGCNSCSCLNLFELSSAFQRPLPLPFHRSPSRRWSCAGG